MEDILCQIGKIILDLEKLADSNGIVKSVLIVRIYEQISEIKKRAEEQSDQWKNEKLIFEAEIQDLKDQIKKEQEIKGA